MTSFFTDQTKEIIKQVSEFALQHVAPAEDLHKTDDFPTELWKKMGEAGLLGIGIPTEYGGKDGNATDISIACHELVKNGNNIGIGLSFLIHQLTAAFIINKFGTEEQKKTYLPDLAAGKKTTCFAVSEPNTGAHPKHLATVAEEHPDGFTLNGEKTYLTNGSIADLFIVVSVTGFDSGKKLFSAYIVPKETEGLNPTEPITLPFFKPSPHSGIVLNDCFVPENALLGNRDTIYDDLVLPFREIEDALMMGIITGALEKQFILLAKHLKNNNIDFEDVLKMEVGKLKTMLDVARYISHESARIIDSGMEHPEKTSLIIYFRNLARDFHVQIEIILKQTKLEKDGMLEVLMNELAASARIGSNVSKIKQMRLGKSAVDFFT